MYTVSAHDEFDLNKVAVVSLTNAHPEVSAGD
jgi:hypothetical protein